MSIYPVRAKTWWVCRKDYDEDMNKSIKFERDIIKAHIKNKKLKCNKCGKIIKDWNKCYISHAYCYGFNDAYCDKKCLKGEK